MKKVKRFIVPVKDGIVPWDYPDEVFSLAPPVWTPPYSQSNTYSTFILSQIQPGSDISQQARFVFYTQGGAVRNGPWTLMTTNNLRSDQVDTNVSLTTYYRDYIENDISVEFRNTQGSVYMVSFGLTTSTSGPSIALESYCASFITGPLDGAAVLRTPPYNGNRPSGYNAQVGLNTVMTGVSQLQDAAVDFEMIFRNLSNSAFPSATWVFEIYKSSSITPLTLVNTGNVVFNQDIPVVGVYLFKFINNHTYTLKLLCFNGGVQVASPFPDIRITQHLGFAFQAARISGVLGNAPTLVSIPSAQANAQIDFTASYLSPFIQTPFNDFNAFAFVQLKIVVTLGSNLYPAIQEGLTVWYNFENATGYWPLCLNQFIGNQSEVMLKTGGTGQLTTQFDELYLSNLVSVSTPLFFNISEFQLNKGAFCSQEYTSNTFTTSLQPLVNLAKSTQNVWVSDPNYLIVVNKTRPASGSVLNLQIFAMYSGLTPPPPPPPTNITVGDIVDLVRNEEVDEGEHIYAKEQKRILKQKYTPEEVPVDDWLLPPINPKETLDRPVFSKQFKLAPHNPAELELVERGKSELVNVLRINPSWRVGTIGEFINEFHKISNPKLRVDFPALNNPQLLAAIANYYGTEARLADLYQPPAFMYKQSPFWESIPPHQKWGGDRTTNFFRELKYSVFGTQKRKALDLEIQKAKMLRGTVDPDNIDYTPFPKLSEPAFNYYWFGLPYNVYNRSQMDMLQSVLEHDKPAVYDKARSVAPIETDMYGYILEIINNEMNDPFNALALTGVVAADRYKMYKKNRNKTSTEIMAETSKQIAKAGTTKGAAQDIAEVAAGVLTTKLAAQVLKTMASPFTQESASAFDYFLTLVNSYGPPILPVYQKKQRAQSRNYLDSMMNTLTQQIKNRDLRQLADNSSSPLKQLADNSSSPLVMLNNSASVAGVPYINATNATDFVNKLEEINTQVYDNLTAGEDVDFDDFDDEPEEIDAGYYEFSSPYKEILGSYETEEDYLEDIGKATKTVNRLYKNWARYNEFIKPSSNESRAFFGATPSNVAPFDLQYAVQTLIQQDKLKSEAETFQFYRNLGYQPVVHDEEKATEILRYAQAKARAKKALNAKKELEEPMSGFLKFASTDGSPYDPIPVFVNKAKKYVQDRVARVSQQEPMTGFLRFGPSTFNPFGKYQTNDAKIRQFEESLKNKSALFPNTSVLPTPTQAQLNSTAKKIANQTIPMDTIVWQQAVRGGINVQEYKKLIQAIETAQNTMRNVSPAILLGAALKIAQKEITDAVKGGQSAVKNQWAKAEKVIKKTEEVYQNAEKPVEKQAPGYWEQLKGYFYTVATPENVNTAAKAGAVVTGAAAVTAGAYAAYNYATSSPQNTTNDIPDPLPAQKILGFLGKSQREKLQKVYNTQVMLTLAKTSNSQVALSLLNSDLAKTDAGRQKQIHAFSELFANLNRNEATFAPKQKNLIFEAFANKFRQNAVKQALKRNMKAFFHYKTLASILKPEDPAEEQIKDLVESYYVGPKIYDSRQSITEQSQNHLDHVESIALNANVLHDFIERTIKGPANTYKRTFNDAFVFDQQRPNYDYNEVVKLKPLKDDFFKKRDTKATKLLQYFNQPAKLDRLSFDNRQFIKQRFI